MVRRLALTVLMLLLLQPSSWAQSLDQFLKAVGEGDVKTVAALLDRGLDPNTTDAQGMTALMTAARLGHQDLVALLIARKASLTRRSPHGDTALMHASLRGHLDVVRLLVEAGAPVAHDGWAPAHFAAFEGRTVVLKYLLDKGADKNALAPNGYTALMLAARGGFVEAARTLLYADADIRVRAPGGETALSIAKGRKDAELEALLRRAGAVD